MSKKRTSAESNNDEQTNKGSEFLEDNAKRAKLDLLSDTTLQDLPIELLECILVKAVAMEVKGLMLAKSVWKEKADLVINRLRTVCSEWSSTLTTISFRTKLHRILDGTAQEIRLKLSSEHAMQSGTRAVTWLNGEMFTIYRLDNRDYIMNAYHHNNVSEVIKEVAPLRETEMVCMAACTVSNCVYVGLQNKKCPRLSVLRISKDVDHQFNMWIKYHRLPITTISVSANGSLIILSVQQGQDPNVVSIYDANGSLQHKIMLSSDIDAFRYKNVIQRSNGNLVLAYVSDQNHQMKLLEIDMGGSVVRQYQSSFGEESFVSVADINGRILIAGPNEGMELFDSELNLLGTYNLQQDEGKNLLLYDLHYDSERNVIWRTHYDQNTETSGLTLFRFTENEPLERMIN